MVEVADGESGPKVLTRCRVLVMLRSMKSRTIRPLSGIVSVWVVTLLWGWPLEHTGAAETWTLRSGIRERGAVPPAWEADLLGQMTKPGEGYRGIWFTLGQFSEHGDKYSGGLGTYTANHVPLAVYASEVQQTFFVYGGTTRAEERHLLIMVGTNQR